MYIYIHYKYIKSFYFITTLLLKVSRFLDHQVKKYWYSCMWKKKKKNHNNFSFVIVNRYLCNYLGQKNTCMFAVTTPYTPSLLKSTGPKLFSRESALNYSNLFKNFCVSLSTTTSYICVWESQRFASPVLFNMIEMVWLLS